MEKKQVNNLKVLMDAFQLSSRDLAAMLNVHYSLISKWLNNQRPLKSNSEHVRNIIECFLDLDESRNYMIIRQTLREYYPKSDLSSREKLAAYVRLFLSTNVPADGVGVWDHNHHEKIDHQAKIDVYEGFEGRQVALTRLINTALRLPPGQELLIFSRESLQWELNIESFSDFWLEKNMEFLRRGGSITVVHMMERSISELIFSLSCWLPLYLTRAARAMYLPKYQDTQINPYAIVLRNYAAVSGLTVDGLTEGLTTYYTTNSNLVEHLDAFVENRVRNCRPLFDDSHLGSITKSALWLSSQPGNSFVYSSMYLQYGLDTEDLKILLKENNLNEESLRQTIDFFNADKARLISKLDNWETHVLMLLDDILESLDTGAIISSFNWITGSQRLHISPAMTRKLLLGYADAMELYPNLHISLLRTPLLPQMPRVSLVVKEKVAVIANASWPNVPGPLITKESSAVVAFYKSFDQVLHFTPADGQDRKAVISLLRQLAAR